MTVGKPRRRRARYPGNEISDRVAAGDLRIRLAQKRGREDPPASEEIPASWEAPSGGGFSSRREKKGVEPHEVRDNERPRGSPTVKDSFYLKDILPEGGEQPVCCWAQSS